MLRLGGNVALANYFPIGINGILSAYVKVDDFQRTTIDGIYAAGDNTTMFRSVAAAVAAGNKAGALLNKELIDEEF